MRLGKSSSIHAMADATITLEMRKVYQQQQNVSHQLSYIFLDGLMVHELVLYLFFQECKGYIYIIINYIDSVYSDIYMTLNILEKV